MNERKKLILYGAGRNGRRILKWFNYCGMGDTVIAFCDRNVIRGEAIENKKVYSYDQLRKMGADWLITPDDKESIANMLLKDEQSFYLSFEDYIENVCPENELAMKLIDKNSIRVDENCRLLQEIYQFPNYRIVTRKKYNSNRCYLYFSSNGLYFPHTVEQVKRRIYVEDYYEWEGVSAISGRLEKEPKSIFIRDIYKNFYVRGINEKIDSIEKLLEFLKEETEGYEVVAVGGSSGGYMAMLAGAVLSAHMVFAFSGQVSLYQYNDAVYGDKYHLMEKYRDDPKYRRYFDISDIVRDTCPVIFFYAADNEDDQRQAAIVQGMRNFYMFPVKSAEHGRTISDREKSRLLSLEDDELWDYVGKYAGTIQEIDASR